MTCIAKLNKRLKIEHRVASSDGAGGSDTVWTNLDTIWANITPKFATEHQRANALTSTTSHTITLRYYPGLKADMRFVLGARVFEIVSIINVSEQNRWHKCACIETPL